jgi:transcriptional regulator with PAS, ATPase and Fis domain
MHEQIDVSSVISLRPERVGPHHHKEHASTERSLNEFLATSNVGLAIFDRNLRYEAINRWLAAIHGIPPARHLGRHVREITGEVASAIEPVLRETFSIGQPILNVEVEGRLPAKTETRRWTGSFFPLSDASGRVDHVLAVVLELGHQRTSVTRQPRNEQQVQTALKADLLRSWKDIAQYLGTCCKTAQRWERAHGLPVRRRTVRKGAAVFAFRSEIDAWLGTGTFQKKTGQFSSTSF